MAGFAAAGHPFGVADGDETVGPDPEEKNQFEDGECVGEDCFAAAAPGAVDECRNRGPGDHAENEALQKRFGGGAGCREGQRQQQDRQKEPHGLHQQIELDAEMEPAELPESEPVHRTGFADVAPAPAQQHFAGGAVTGGNDGAGDRIALKDDPVVIGEQKGGEGAVFGDMSRFSEEFLVHPLVEKREQRGAAVGTERSGSAEYGAEHALGGAHDLEAEYEVHIHHARQNAVLKVQYPDAARHSGDFGVGEGEVQEPQSVGFDYGIAVHGHDHFGTGLPDAAVQGMALAAVLFQFDGGDAPSRPGGCKLDPVPGVVGAAVVDRQDFKFGGGIVACEDAVECVQHRFAFVVGRDDHGAGRQFPVGERPAGTVPQAGEKHQESIIEDIDPEHSQAEQGEKPDGTERLEIFQ